MDRNILFLCTGNSARSQMAEAFLRKHAGDTFRVYSAGLEPADEIFPPVRKVMDEAGYDLKGQYPKNVKKFLGEVLFESVIIVCGNAEKNCPSAFLQSQKLSWPFDDPRQFEGTEEETLAFCREVRDRMEEKIIEWLKGKGI